MALAAAQVVDALAARLVSVVATGGRVSTSRTWPLTEADLPAWRVQIGDEAVRAVTLDGLNEHTLSVDLQACALATADLDDVLNGLASAGLAALFSPTTPYELRHVGTGRRMQQQDQASLGVVTLSVEAVFHVYPAQPDTII